VLGRYKKHRFSIRQVQEKTMLNIRQNLLETLKENGKPDRLVKQFEGTVLLPGDPVNFYVRGERMPGMAPNLPKRGRIHQRRNRPIQQRGLRRVADPVVNSNSKEQAPFWGACFFDGHLAAARQIRP
jgi:hypothetical protein